MLLDSTVLIDALRGRPAAQRIREMRTTGGEPWPCAVSVEEIWRGIGDHEAPLARRLFRALRIAPLGVTEGEVAGTWRRTFARQGVTLQRADCLIAAAVDIDAELTTGNPTDFPMLGLRVRHWRVGT
ncbi:MAG: PIN domain-containing protein [Acidimicrobiia bacterium]|nr:PIN domain-containing protein [Acidimicrobiia bacterium]